MTHSRSYSGLYVTDDLYQQSSGIFASLLGTIRILRARGHKPTVVGGGGVITRADDLWGGTGYTFTRAGPRSLGLYPGLQLWLYGQEQSWDFVSIQSVWQLSNASVVNWCLRNARPWMVTAHGMFNPAALRVSSWKKQLARRTLLRRLLEEATCFQALTEAEYTTLREFGIRQPVCLIGNGVTLPDVSRRRRETRESITGTRTMAYLGRLHPIKGVERLIDAWCQAGLVDPWRLVIAGDGSADYRRELEARANRCGRQRIDFVGFVSGERKAHLLEQADVVILPSHSEAFPMTAMEAWSYATPVVLTAACGFSAAAERGAAVEVPSSVDGIVEGIRYVAGLDPLDLEAMGVRGREFVERDFSWERVCAQLVSVYAWMCGHGAAPECLRMD